MNSALSKDETEFYICLTLFPRWRSAVTIKFKQIHCEAEMIMLEGVDLWMNIDAPVKTATL